MATAVGRAAVGEPVNGIVETGGPEKVRMADFIGAALARTGDERKVVADPDAAYFGTRLADDSLVPGPDAVLGTTSHEEWLAGAGR